MDLTHYTLLALSVAATLFTIVLVVLLVAGLYIFARIQKVLHQLEAINSLGLEAVSSLKAFVETTTSRATAFIEAFTTIQGAKEVMGRIGEAINHNKSKRKEKNE